MEQGRDFFAEGLDDCLRELQMKLRVRDRNIIIEDLRANFIFMHLEHNDWAKPKNITDIVLKRLDGGKYVNRKKALYISRQLTEAGLDNLYQQYQKYKKYVGKKQQTNTIIQEMKMQWCHDKDKFAAQKFKGIQLTGYDLFIFLCIIDLFEEEELRKTYKHFEKGRYDLLNFPQYEALVCYLNKCVTEGRYNGDEEIFGTNAFKYYMLYQLESKYQLSTIEKIAYELRHYKRKREARLVFLKDVQPLLVLPLQIRNKMIESYHDYFKAKALDKWYEQARALHGIYFCTLTGLFAKLGDTDSEAIKSIYEDLIAEFQSPKALKKLIKNCKTSLTYGKDFGNCKDVYRTYQEANDIYRKARKNCQDSLPNFEGVNDRDLLEEFSSQKFDFETLRYIEEKIRMADWRLSVLAKAKMVESWDN